MKVFTTLGGSFESGDVTARSVANGIVLAEVIFKGIRPKTGVKIASSEFCAKCVTNVAMRTFDKTILVRRISAGGENIVVELFKKFPDGRIFIKLAALVEVHVLVLDGRTWGVTFEERANPDDGSTFVDSGFTVKTTGEMVASKNVTGLTIEACIVEGTFLVLGLLPGEGKIKAQSLIRYSSFPSSVGSRSAFLHLGLDANRAGFENGVCMMKLGDAIDIFMGSIKMFITDVIEALMPKKAFGRNMQLLDLEFGRIRGPVNVGDEFVNMTSMSTCIFRRGGISAMRRSAGQDDGCSVEKAPREDTVETNILGDTMLVVGFKSKCTIGMR
jgi:hypothetical protein